jgi:F0F1-type ATP synthase membrane subunit b/b'
MGVSTFLRIGWTRSRLEAQLSESAKETARVIAAELDDKRGAALIDATIADLPGQLH